MSTSHPNVVKQMLKQAESIRKDLGEFMQRGKAQRPTGSIFPKSPVISHEKDWGQVPAEISKSLEAERTKRHPQWKDRKRRKK